MLGLSMEVAGVSKPGDFVLSHRPLTLSMEVCAQTPGCSRAPNQSGAPWIATSKNAIVDTTLHQITSR